MTIGFLTVDQGQQALIYDLNGSARVVDGPQRIFLWREKARILVRRSANQTEYLILHRKDGKVEHMAGPCAVFENPLVYRSITVQQTISLDANEVLVVYKQDRKGQVQRRLQYGPVQYIPGPDEWLHSFVWHGTDPKNKTHKVPGALTFTKLRVIPDQFYYNVEEVRTNDDALITVKLMVFFELREIETMLAQTADPIADFINGMCADVVAFASQLSYEEFLENTSKLNMIDSYPQLKERSKKIGYEVTKVVFRGYHASSLLQGMHDSAVSSRTNIRLKMETEEQEQNLADYKLQSELERVETEQKLELQTMRHKQKLEKQQVEHQVDMQRRETAEKIRQFKAEGVAKREALKAEHAQQVNYLQQLASSDVDVTEYLLSLNPHPHKVTRLVMSGRSGTAPNLHIHPTGNTVV